MSCSAAMSMVKYRVALTQDCSCEGHEPGSVIVSGKRYSVAIPESAQDVAGIYQAYSIQLESKSKGGEIFNHPRVGERYSTLKEAIEALEKGADPSSDTLLKGNVGYIAHFTLKRV